MARTAATASAPADPNAAMMACVHCGRVQDRREMNYQGPPSPYREPDNPKWWYCDYLCVRAKVDADAVNTQPCQGCGKPVRRDPATGRIAGYCARDCREAHNRTIGRALRAVVRCNLPNAKQAMSTAELARIAESLTGLRRDFDSLRAWWDQARRPRSRRGGERDGELGIDDVAGGESPNYWARLMQGYDTALMAAQRDCGNALRAMAGAEQQGRMVSTFFAANRERAARREALAAKLEQETSERSVRNVG